MSYFTRRTLIKGGTAAAAAGALTGPRSARMGEGLGTERALET